MPTSNDNEYWKLSACDVVKALRSEKVSPLTLLNQLEERIGKVDPHINSLPTTCFERAKHAATKIEAKSVESRGMLAGLPIVIKDSISVADVRTTYGSLVYKDNIPQRSDVLVEHLESEGAIVFAKSNTPEFEAGASTWNEVFGITSNPWNTELTAGGSSGGAAAAVATGLAWLAQGTDFACSLRNPASFCGVVGLRPSPGLVAQGPQTSAFQTLSVAGPIARNVGDVALFLDAMKGSDARDPLSCSSQTESYLHSLEQSSHQYKVAYSADLGISPIETSIANYCKEFAMSLNESGIEVEQAHPDLTGCHEAFRTLRALHFATFRGDLITDHREEMKPDVVWNIEEGMALSAHQIIRAEKIRSRLCQNMFEFFRQFDFLITPGAIVNPFPKEQRYVEECAGHKFENYLEWMALGYAITLVGYPAISIPCGFSSEGMPVGLQIVGPHRGEEKLLAFAQIVESIAQANSGPIDPRNGSFAQSGTKA